MLSDILIGLLLIVVFLVVPCMFVHMVWQRLRGRYVPLVASNESGPGPSFPAAVAEFVLFFAWMVFLAYRYL